MKLDVLDLAAVIPAEINLTEGLDALNKSFESQVAPENGYFGVTEIDKGNGLTEIIGKNDQGHTYKEYLTDGVVYKRRVNLGGHEVATTDFDDRGTSYMTTVKRLADNKCSITKISLEPDTTIVKGNFTAKTDFLGRPIFNMIEDLEIRPTESPRQSLSNSLRDESYLADDHRGHIIADEFGGPATRENVIPQNQDVNLSKFREIERIVEALKADGHRVDYEVKTNYVGSGERPSSFEPRILVDGEEHELPVELKKIYNSKSGGGSIGKGLSHVATDLGERFGYALEHADELGLRSAGIAAALTFSVSTYDNVASFLDGGITAEEMVAGIVGDTALAGGLAYGTTFVSISVAEAMSKSSSALISRIGGSCAPALVVSFGVQSFRDINDYAQGSIDAEELAYNLGEDAAEVAGGFMGGALLGGAMGSIAGPPGAIVGSLIGGTIGCVLASEIYATAVEVGAEGVEALASQVETLANATVDLVTVHIPESIDDVRGALNGFFSENSLPFSV